jgi:hypothetical protein
VLSGFKVEGEGVRHRGYELDAGFVRHVVLCDVDIKSSSVQLCGCISDGVDISSHFIEGVAASTNREQLVSCIVFVSLN